MAVVCEHCSDVVKPGEEAIREGFSYHTKCQKCYICSETNLQNAEIFRGVIFCSGCSRRIFQGCSSARRVKTRSGRKRRGMKRQRTNNNRIIELARLNTVLNSDSSRSKTSVPISTDNTVVTNKTYVAKPFDLKKKSIDTATTTDVTQELLKHIYSIDNNEKIASPVKPRKKCKNHMENKNKKELCSDLRIAELGMSTEIAHMTLRRRSELPLVIKSESALKRPRSNSLSYISQESDSSGDGDQSSYYSKDLMKRHWIDRRLRSIVKLPYQSFKRNILQRSSLISAVMETDDSRDCIIRNFKRLFREEVTEHQRRGLRRLFSTINRNKLPYKLGWLQVMDRIPEDAGLNDSLAKRKQKRCRHFRTSHSYRCMRRQAMKLAGPTRSELGVLRSKLKYLFCYDLWKRLLNSNKQLIRILTLQAST